MGVRVRFGTVASQGCATLYPLNGSTGRLVVVAHGAFTSYNFVTDQSVSWPKLRDMAYYLAERGFVVAVPELSVAALAVPSQPWGNDASTDQLDSVVTALQALPGVGADSIALIGCSMGGVTCLNHARRQSYAGIAGILGLAPAVAISPYRGTDADQGGSYAAVNSAFAVANDTAWDAAKVTYEPINFGDEFTFPVALWTNSNDLLATPGLADLMEATNTTWISRADLGESAGTSGHDFDLVVPSDVHDWLESLTW